MAHEPKKVRKTIKEISFSKASFRKDALRAAEKYNALPAWKKDHLTVSQRFSKNRCD